MIESLFTPELSIDKWMETAAMKAKILKFWQIKFNKIAAKKGDLFQCQSGHTQSLRQTSTVWSSSLYQWKAEPWYFIRLFQLGCFILISCSMVGSSKRFKSIGQKSKTEKETNIY